MGATFENTSSMLTGSLALISAVLVIGFMLYSSSIFERMMGKQGL